MSNDATNGTSDHFEEEAPSSIRETPKHTWHVELRDSEEPCMWPSAEVEASTWIEARRIAANRWSTVWHDPRLFACRLP